MKTHPNTIEALDRLLRTGITLPLSLKNTEINMQTLADLVDDVKALRAMMIEKEDA